MAYPIDAILGPVSVFKVPVANTDGTTPQEGDVLYRDTNGNPQWGSSALIARSLVQLANLAAIQAQATISRTKVYVAADTGKQYMWTGEGSTGNWTVAEVNAGLALGETSATAYRGDRGKTAYDHSQAIATAEEFVAGTDKTKNATVGFLKDATALDGFWLTRRTKMPDGASAVYAKDMSTDPAWSVLSNATVAHDAVNKIYTITVSGSGSWYAATTPAAFGGSWTNKVMAVLIKSSVARNIIVYGGTTSLVNIGTIPVSTEWSVLLFQNHGAAAWRVGFGFGSGKANDTLEMRYLWIGDYSYLAGSLTEEAARVVNQLGDTTGVGAKATTTLTSNGTNISNDDTVTLAGKVYTFKTALTPAEGEVLIGATYTDSLDNLVAAITGGAGNGTLYSCAAAHPLVTASRNGAVVTITALQAGILGNQITTSKSATTLTLANPAGGTTTLAGGVDDWGAKAKAQLGAALGAGAQVGALPNRTNSNIIGYFDVVDCASGAQVTLPAGGTWVWLVETYGATYNGAKCGTAAGGAAITGTASANLTMYYERIA